MPNKIISCFTWHWERHGALNLSRCFTKHHSIEACGMYTIMVATDVRKYSEINLTLYAPCIILQYVYKPTRCTKFLWLDFIFSLDVLHVSECISPSSGATFIRCTSRLVYAGTIRLAIATQQPDVPAYTGVYQTRCTAYKVAPDDGLIQSETCRASNRKWSLITIILCILLVHIHTVGWCTVHTKSKNTKAFINSFRVNCSVIKLQWLSIISKETPKTVTLEQLKKK